MSLGDIVGRLGLGTFPTVAMVLFLVIFSVAMWRVFSRHLGDTYRHLAALPLEGDEPARCPTSAAANAPRTRNRR